MVNEDVGGLHSVSSSSGQETEELRERYFACVKLFHATALGT